MPERSWVWILSTHARFRAGLDIKEWYSYVKYMNQQQQQPQKYNNKNNSISNSRINYSNKTAVPAATKQQQQKQQQNNNNNNKTTLVATFTVFAKNFEVKKISLLQLWQQSHQVEWSLVYKCLFCFDCLFCVRPSNFAVDLMSDGITLGA